MQVTKAIMMTPRICRWLTFAVALLAPAFVLLGAFSAPSIDPSTHCGDGTALQCTPLFRMDAAPALEQSQVAVPPAQDPHATVTADGTFDVPRAASLAPFTAPLAPPAPLPPGPVAAPALPPRPAPSPAPATAALEAGPPSSITPPSSNAPAASPMAPKPSPGLVVAPEDAQQPLQIEYFPIPVRPSSSGSDSGSDNSSIGRCGIYAWAHCGGTECETMTPSPTECTVEFGDNAPFWAPKWGIGIAGCLERLGDLMPRGIHARPTRNCAEYCIELCLVGLNGHGPGTF